MKARAVNVYQYEDFRRFFRDLASSKWGRNGAEPTLQQWAQGLGYRSKRGIGMVLTGSRLPSREMLSRIASRLGLSALESRYVELLVTRERAHRAGKKVDAFDEALAALNARLSHHRVLSPGTFERIAPWHHLVLRQLVATPSFRYDLDWIGARLKNKVSPTEIRLALERLVEVGLLELDADPKRKYCLPRMSLRTSQDLPDAAIILHHLQMLKRAEEAMTEEAPTQRENLTLTLRVSARRLGEAKELLRKFREDFDRHFADGEADDVYQLLVHFFPHTQSST